MLLVRKGSPELLDGYSKLDPTLMLGSDHSEHEGIWSLHHLENSATSQSNSRTDRERLPPGS